MSDSPLPDTIFADIPGMSSAIGQLGLNNNQWRIQDLKEGGARSIACEAHAQKC